MINILPPEVYNRIAAGEVVDRPYSVVKELVENAIDAGATEITVEAEGGGKKLIRVTDNGSGIRKEDLKAAFLPHATSKLKTADDLAAIFTLGFRGEAVASVASVSKTTILSRRPSSPARRGRKRTRSPWKGASSAKFPPQAARRAPSSPSKISFTTRLPASNS